MKVKDRNGVEITVGAAAVVLGEPGDWCNINGKIGTVRDIRLGVGALRGKPGLRIAAGPEGDPEWSAWVEPGEIAVVPSAAPARAE